MEELTIGQVAGKIGIRPSAVRYYESIGLLAAPRRVNGRRRYGPLSVQQLTAIRSARQAGFTIATIRLLFQGFAPGTPPAGRWQAPARQKLPELTELIARAERTRRLLEDGRPCDCLRLEDCLIDKCDEGGRRSG